MRLYLASYAKETLDKVLKNDGINPKGKTAVFIPTAGDPYNNKDFVVADKEALKNAGFNVKELDIKKESDETEKTILQADIVLIAGGDTFYLMYYLKKTGADKILKKYIDNNGLYVGSSASSIICCPTIEGAVEFDDPSLVPELKSYSGLGVFPGVVIPHAHKEKYFELIARATEKLKQKGFKVFHLTDDEVLFYDGSSSEILTK